MDKTISTKNKSNNNETRPCGTKAVIDTDDSAYIAVSVLQLIEDLALEPPVTVTAICWNGGVLIGRCPDSFKAEPDFKVLVSASSDAPFSLPAHFLFLDINGRTFSGELFESDESAESQLNGGDYHA